MKALGGRGSIVATILDLSTRWGVSGQRHAIAVIYPLGKDPRYSLYRRLGGPQSRSGHGG
jgi:hypothetical protein